MFLRRLHHRHVIGSLARKVTSFSLQRVKRPSVANENIASGTKKGRQERTVGVRRSTFTEPKTRLQPRAAVKEPRPMSLCGTS